MNNTFYRYFTSLCTNLFTDKLEDFLSLTKDNDHTTFSSLIEFNISIIFVNVYNEMIIRKKTGSYNDCFSFILSKKDYDNRISLILLLYPLRLIHTYSHNTPNSELVILKDTVNGMILVYDWPHVGHLLSIITINRKSTCALLSSQ